MYNKYAKLNLIVSVVLIIIIYLSVLFHFDWLSQICVCILNFLAWALTALAISMLSSIIIIFLKSIGLLKSLKKGFLFALLILQSISLLCGIILLIFFTVKLLNVI